MTLAIPRLTRRSRYLFDFDAAACLSNAEQALTAVSGQTATFTRASTKYALDAAGRYQCVPYGLPAYEWVDLNGDGIRESVGVLLEGARTNLVVQSDALATSPWLLTNTSGSAAVTNAAGTYAGRPFSRFHFGNPATDYCGNVVTLTGDGAKGCACLVRYDGSAGTVLLRLLWDTTSSAPLATVTCTFASDGTMTAAATAGTLLATEALADGVYRILMQSASATAAHANEAYVAPGGTATSVLVSGFQVEDAAFPSSLIPTTTTTVTRAADALSFPYNALPGAMAVYADTVERGAGDDSYLWAIGIPGSADAIGITRNAAASKYRGVHWGTATPAANADTIPAAGTRAEVRLVLNTDGSLTVGSSIAGAAETTASDATVATPSAFSNALLWVNSDATPANRGFAVYRRIRIASGAQTLAYMRVG